MKNNFSRRSRSNVSGGSGFEVAAALENVRAVLIALVTRARSNPVEREERTDSKDTNGTVAIRAYASLASFAITLIPWTDRGNFQFRENPARSEQKNNVS